MMAFFEAEELPHQLIRTDWAERSEVVAVCRDRALLSFLCEASPAADPGYSYNIAPETHDISAEEFVFTVWHRPDNGVHQVIAASINALIALAAFDVACTVEPGSQYTVQHGWRIIRKHPEHLKIQT